MGGGRKGCHPLELVLLRPLSVGVGFRRESVRAEILTSTIFPRSVPFILWHVVNLVGGDPCLVRGTRAVV